MTIRIVTDSASDIPWDFARENNIKVVPLYMVVHDEILKEDENFDRDAYYKVFEDEKAFVHIPKLNMHSFVPNTSQPNPQDFEVAYTEAIEEGAKDIIVINVTAGLSGTINSSSLAAKKIMRKNPKVKIHIIDAKSASYPEVFLIRMALNLIKQKKSADQIVEILNEQAIKIRTIILLPTIFYLWKGGRLGRFGTAKFALGSLLRKKPIVTMNEEGYVKTAGEAKDVHKGLKKSLKLSLENAPTEPKAFTIVYGSRRDYAEELAELIKQKFPKIEIEIAQSGGSVLSHLGPESIGLITDYTDDEHWK